MEKQRNTLNIYVLIIPRGPKNPKIGNTQDKRYMYAANE